MVPDFVVQDGDPRGDGEGGPGYTIRDEINQRPYLRGTVGMALDWADTGGSQFFITHSPQPHLDGRYTVFGQVVTGMDVVDELQQWDTIRSDPRVGRRRLDRQRRALDARSASRKKKGRSERPLFDLPAGEAYRFFAFLPSWPPSLLSLPSVNPPLQVGLCVSYAAPPAVASAAWHSARGCRLSSAPCCALTVHACERAMREKGGAVCENRPCKRPYRFFALFFFAAFFAFFAIVSS